MKHFRLVTLLLILSCLIGCSDKQLDVKVLYWNIQNGMWSDQGNDYDNFADVAQLARARDL